MVRVMVVPGRGLDFCKNIEMDTLSISVLDLQENSVGNPSVTHTVTEDSQFVASDTVAGG